MGWMLLPEYPRGVISDIFLGEVGSFSAALC